MKLGVRLSAAAELVPEGSFLLDVGCDHAYLPIALVTDKKVPAALASDVREGPLEAASEHISEMGLQDRIRTVLADGIPKDWQRLLSELSGNPSERLRGPVCCSILGMGGQLIASILQKGEGRDRISDLVVSPQRDVPLVRKTLTELGYGIAGERFVREEGKGYVLIHAKAGDGVLSPNETEYAYGPVLLRERNPLYLEHLKGLRKEYEKILEALPQHAVSRRKEVLDELTRLSEIL